jgi:hypothetical protein
VVTTADSTLDRALFTPVSRRHRRRGRRLLLGTAIGTATTLVAVAVSVTVYSVWSYRPLAPASLNASAMWNADGTLLSSSQSPGDDAPVVWHAPPHAAPAGLAFTLANQGRFGVTVDSVTFPDWTEMTHRRVLLTTVSQGWSGSAFHPVALGANATATVALRFDVPCGVLGAGQGTFVEWRSVTVGYRFLGVHHTMSVALRPPVVVASASTCSR